MNRHTVALGIALLVVEVSVAIALVATSDHEPNKVATIALAVTAGVAFVVSGLLALALRPENRTGVYLAATGYVWFLSALSESNDEWVFTVGFVLGNLVWVPFTALVLAYPTGRLETRLERSIPVVSGILLFVTPLLAAVLDANPAQGCDSCPGSNIAVANITGAGAALDAVSTVIGLVLIALVVGILVRRWRNASPALRRLLWPVAGAGVAALLSVALLIVADHVSHTVAGPLSVVFLAAFVAVPLSFLFGVLRTRLARSASATMFLSLEEGAPLRDALARALNDPSLEVAYWLTDRGIWVGADGTRLPAPEAGPQRSVRIIERGGQTTAALIHDPALDQEPELIGSIAKAAALSLHNEGLRAALRAQYLFLETITDTAPSLLIAIGLDGHILNQNRAAVAAAGYDAQEDVRGLLFWDAFMDPEDRHEVVERFRAAVPDFAPAEYENTFVNRRGEQLTIAWRSAPLLDDSGAAISIIAGGTDVTDRKARALELERERDATTTVLQAISSAIAVLGRDLTIRDRDADNPLAAVNRAFREALEWRDEDLVHRSFLELIALADRDRAKEALEDAVAGQSSAPVESRWLTAAGGEVAFEWSVTPVADVTGRTDGLVLVSGSDVTERRQHESEIRASRARLVRASDEARQQLERNLHDGAQQRLVALSVSLRLAESKLADDPDAAAAIVAGAREELAHALDELRELARGIHPAVLTDRGLAPAVDAIVNRSPVPVEVNVPPGRLPAPVEAASYYVIAEALTNVAKYADASVASVRVTQEDGRVVVEISDDGSGGADPARGSGLRGLGDRVAALDGTLVVESPIGHGTRVRAEIPVLDGGRREYHEDA